MVRCEGFERKDSYVEQRERALGYSAADRGFSCRWMVYVWCVGAILFGAYSDRDWDGHNGRHACDFSKRSKLASVGAVKVLLTASACFGNCRSRCVSSAAIFFPITGFVGQKLDEFAIN